MSRFILAILALASVSTAVIASPEFMVYEGKNAVHDGQGGERKTVNGIDLWFHGDPPRRYRVLGAISDRRMKTGIYGAIRMSGLQVDIAKAAAAAGGDAVILDDEGDDVMGVSGFGSAYGSRCSAFGSAFSAPVKAHLSRYIVVKYLPDSASDVNGSSPAGVAPPN